MAKDDVIEALAKARFEGFNPGAEAWEEIRPVEQTMFRDMVREDWPLIVEFVAEWINDYWGIESVEATAEARQWEKDMGA
jgi:hypothetical protein